MKILGLLVVSLLSFTSIGCVTPAAVKEASTRHTQNLSALDTAVAAYQKSLTAYYDRLIALQRNAYVAQHMTDYFHETATTQAESARRLGDDTAKDFILAGAEMASGFEFWGRNFDFWMGLEGATVGDKRAALKKQADVLETAGEAQAANNLREQAQRDDEDLTYVWVGCELRRTQQVLDAQIGVLAAQVATMREFHAKIDDFLSIDATIDGEKIAEAAAAGSQVDVSGLLGRGGQ